MQLFKTLFLTEEGNTGHCDVIEYEDRLWIIPKWLPSECGKDALPERMILLTQFQWRRFDPPLNDGIYVAHFSIDENLSSALLYGDLSKLAGTYTTIDRPTIKFSSCTIVR